MMTEYKLHRRSIRHPLCSIPSVIRVFDPRFETHAIFKSNRVANFLDKTLADLLPSQHASPRACSHTTKLCAAYTTVICVTGLGEVLHHLSNLA